MNTRRVVIAAIAAFGVLAIGVGTATAASSTTSQWKPWKKCPPMHAMSADVAWKAGGEAPFERRTTPRRCLPDVSIPTPVTKPTPVTRPPINCITAPCCQPNQMCIPELPRAPITTKPPTTVKPSPDVTIEPWLQNPPIYCPMQQPSVDTAKVPQKIAACGCPSKFRLATDGGVSTQVMCPALKPDVSILPAPASKTLL